ncbi:MULTISPECIES: terpene synthase family protein [Thermomonospora]|uniref:Uncharacterized protein n=1 Tax=Thermomonospora curvata (strain ATCC 19995 / DSM 43183 / JCM 3096 / KCTC 9072 / NBRC 15933 / NCIMB 10081 / Henssen B9) TaxID=471852 RepID=D1AD23_THECD|nr:MULTISPECIES: terpene synthase family protein [Thermomonospora]ACY99332.1 hypothetical protein Tcur_3801 [Thermomonospora curvata DSM 43183]
MAVRAAQPSPFDVTATGPGAEAAARICTVAGKLQRRMRGWAVEFPAPYDPRSFDPGLYSMLALAAAFSDPHRTVDQLQPAGRMSLWVLGLGRRVAHLASEPELWRLIEHYEAVADGASPDPDDDLSRFLAVIHRELAALPAHPVLYDAWQEELRRTLRALARSWTTARAGRRPSFEEYLRDADGFGLALTFAAHRIATGDSGPAEDLADAARAVQRAVRLSADLGAAGRGLDPGEPNALTLGLPRPAVELRLAEATGQARTLLAAARARHREQADYMERHMDFYAGFFGTAPPRR